jgi:hypothetical protein
MAQSQPFFGGLEPFYGRYQRVVSNFKIEPQTYN